MTCRDNWYKSRKLSKMKLVKQCVVLGKLCLQSPTNEGRWQSSLGCRCQLRAGGRPPVEMYRVSHILSGLLFLWCFAPPARFKMYESVIWRIRTQICAREALEVPLPRSWPERSVRAVSPQESPASIRARAKFRQSTAAPFEAKLSEWLMVEWAQRESANNWTSAAPSCSSGWSGRRWDKDSATSQARAADPTSIRQPRRWLAWRRENGISQRDGCFRCLLGMAIGMAIASPAPTSIAIFQNPGDETV